MSIFYEISHINGVKHVRAIDEATGYEISLMCPRTLSDEHAKRLAHQKLLYVLKKKNA